MKKLLKLTAILAALALISCSTSKMSKKEVADYAAKLNYATLPASLFGTAKDVKIHYEEAGCPCTPTMILIHGFSSSTLTWNKSIPELAKYFHVIAIDLPGWGFSDKPKDFRYNIDSYRKTVVGFMDAKKIDKAALAGNSMGGGVSWSMALYNPERVTNLILIDALGYPMKTPGVLKLATKPWIRPIAKPFFGKAILRTGLKQVYYDDSKVTPELVDLYGRAYKTENAKDVPYWVMQNRVSFTVEESKKISSINIPTLIIWGENDPWIPVENAHKFNNDIKGSVLVIIPKCGHVPEEEKPEEVVKAILSFMGKVQ